jgi:hypothetical protein
MKEHFTPLTDDHLQSLQGLQEAGTDEFFYTRLKAKMLARQTNGAPQGWSLPLKPVWVVGTLVLLLVINGFILTQQYKMKEVNSSAASSSPLQNFAASYDQSISSY